MSASTLAALTPARRKQVVQLFQRIQTTRPVSNFVRVMPRIYSHNPISFSGGPSRFSPLEPNQGPDGLFGIIYLAIDLATAAYESLIRDRFDLNPSRILLPLDYFGHDAVNISTSTAQSVTLLDLSQGNAVRSGVPADVIRYSIHTDGQYFSEFVHGAMPTVDGFLYDSRLTERPCIAIYDRACHKLTAAPSMPLTQPLLTSALLPWNFSVRKIHCRLHCPLLPSAARQRASTVSIQSAIQGCTSVL